MNTFGKRLADRDLCYANVLRVGAAITMSKISASRSRSLSVIRTRSNREQKEEATAENAHQFFLQANLQLATPKRFTSAECTRAALAATTRRARTPDRRRVALRVVCLPREQGTHALDRKN